MIYLDSAATSPLLPVVKEKMFKVLEELSLTRASNASALYSSGVRSKELIESARRSVAKLLNARPSEILFTSGGSESNNTVIHTFAEKTLAVSAVEHPSILRPAEAYARSLSKIPVDQTGKIDLEFLKNLLNSPEPPALVSVMTANNELGVLEPITEVVKNAKRGLDLRNSPQKPPKVHTDATQAVGKIPLDVKALDVDYLTFSAHKIGGPLGVGVLYVKSGSPLKPLILGGEQENSRRAGTYNLPGIVGLGAAADYCLKNKTWETYETTIRPLRNFLAKELLKKVPSARLNTDLKNSLPNLLNLSFPAAEGESIQLYLDLSGIQVSTGSACASGSLEPSHVLMAIHHDPESAHNSIRFSLNLETTKSDLEKVIETLPPIIKKLQGISTIKTNQNQTTNQES